MTKKIEDMTPEQQVKAREGWRNAKAAKREKQKLERERQEPLAPDDHFDVYCASPERKQVDQYVTETSRKIYDELGIDPADVLVIELSPRVTALEEALGRVLSLSFCIEHNLVWQTTKGPIYGLFWAEVSGEDIVRWRHQLDLTRSKTFSDIYWPLVRKLDEMYGTNIISKDPCYRSSAQAIKDELAGTYVYPPVPAQVVKVEPKPEPEPAPEPDNLENILASKKKQLEDDLARYSQINQFVGPDALKYLDGSSR